MIDMAKVYELTHKNGKKPMD